MWRTIAIVEVEGQSAWPLTGQTFGSRPLSLGSCSVFKSDVALDISRCLLKLTLMNC